MNQPDPQFVNDRNATPEFDDGGEVVVAYASKVKL
jgi:hypothetical protein